MVAPTQDQALASRLHAYQLENDQLRAALYRAHRELDPATDLTPQSPFLELARLPEALRHQLQLFKAELRKS
ncbi:hypothetical protein ACQ3G6_17410 [Allorhizobium undicola]|uniref:hypothetical protein n=1 Tax=Allorhizobium undicola TaxID=78527 RepID=UPI003D352640